MDTDSQVFSPWCCALGEVFNSKTSLNQVIFQFIRIKRNAVFQISDIDIFAMVEEAESKQAISTRGWWCPLPSSAGASAHLMMMMMMMVMMVMVMVMMVMVMVMLIVMMMVW